MPTVTRYSNLLLDNFDCHILLCALRERWRTEAGTLRVLRISRRRKLTRVERFLLPLNLQLLSDKELSEQVDAWISLIQQIKHLMKQIEKSELMTTPPAIQKRRDNREVL